MSATQPPQLDLEMLERLAQSIRDVGVVGNDGDLRFDAHNARESLAALQAHLREAGYAVGTLEINTLAEPHDGMDTLIYDPRRHVNLAEAERAWERDYGRRWHNRIERRADDWIERLHELRSQMAAWLQDSDLAHLAIVDQPPVRMSEPLMQRFGVEPRMMPTFEIRVGAQRVMRFLPKALWIIGANGRVDLITKVAAPILVDRSEPLSRPSNWQLYDSSNLRDSVPLTEATFRNLVHAGL